MARKTPEEKVSEVQKVVMYSRIGYTTSTEEDDVKFLCQEAAMQKFCDDNGIEVKAKYREVAVGTLDHWSRPILEQAVDSVKWSRKEKSVLLVSRLDRLTKSFGTLVKLMDGYNPKFLTASLGTRYDPFLFTVQAASYEEEFRQKYGSLYRTSGEGLQTFYNRHKFFMELMLKNGETKEAIAHSYMWRFVPAPDEIEWNVETIDNILKYGENK